MDNLQQATYEDLLEVDEIGEKIADSIVQYFQEQKVIDLIQELKELGINMSYLGAKPTELEKGSIF
jgi:DNA ligase (NAD+)